MDSIMKRLNQIADYYGLTSYADFSKKTGLSFQTASNYLKGHRKPTIEKLSKINQSFNEINERWLLTGKGSMLKDSSVSVKGINSVVGDNNINVGNSNVVSKDSDVKVGVTDNDQIKELTQIVKTAQDQQTKLMDQLSEKDKQINKLLEHQEKLINKLTN